MFAIVPLPLGSLGVVTTLAMASCTCSQFYNASVPVSAQIEKRKAQLRVDKEKFALISGENVSKQLMLDSLQGRCARAADRCTFPDCAELVLGLSRAHHCVQAE